MSLPVRVETLMTAEESRREFLNNLNQKRLEEKFFYWTPLSVEAWVKLCDSKEYKNYSSSYRCVRRVADDVVSLIQGQEIFWIALGCGDAAKEILFLRSLKKRHVGMSLLAVDFSRSLLEKACEMVQTEGIEVAGCLADITNARHLGKISRQAGASTKIYSLLGNNLGAFNKDRLLRGIAKNMKAGDYFLVDGEIYHGKSTYEGYENRANRNFVMAPLHSIGVEERDGDLTLTLEPDPQVKGFYRIRKYFRFKRGRTLDFSGTPITYEKGDTLQMPYSYKYDYNAFIRLLQNTKGLEVKASFFSDDCGYVIVLLRKEDYYGVK